MAKTETRLPYPAAVALAEKIRQVLRPACERIEIAGSIRRRAPGIGDIELLAIPRMIPDPSALFDGGYVSQLDGLLDQLVSDGRLLRGDVEGDKRMHFRVPARPGVGVDLYIARPEQWGVLFAVRTGPADFARKLVTQQSYGGYLTDGHRVHDWRIWAPHQTFGHVELTGDRLWKPKDETTLYGALDTPEEARVFDVLTCGWIEPEERR